MPATLVDDQANGLSVSRDEVGAYTVTLSLHAKDLTGATILDKLAAAEGLLGTDYDYVTYRGQVLPRQKLSLDPWPPADTGITLTFAKTKAQGGGNPTGGDFGKALLSGGTNTELTETDFDWDNLQLDYADRKTITVGYNKNSDLAPSTDALYQDARVPRYAARSTFTFSRVEMSDPSGRSREFGSKTNSTAFLGMEAETVLCASYLFEQQLDGSFRASITFAWDPAGWEQFARFVLDDGKFPALRPSQVAAQNGITEVVVQGEANFNDLAIQIYTP